MNEVVETRLREEVSAVEQKAMDVVISTDTDYSFATDFTKQVKSTMKKVDDYWEPMRKSTYEAYKAVTDHKSQMLSPLKKAEELLKRKISNYLIEVEKKRREAEEAARKAAMEEANRKLEEARAAELNGDFDAAEMAMAEADVMEQAAGTISVTAEGPKVEGIIRKKDWEIVSINADEVPVSVAGVEIRPVDDKAIISLIRGTKGKVTIPGVVYREKVNVSVRV